MADSYYSDVTREAYLKTDFIRLIEQRVRKHIRLEHTIDQKKSYVLHDDGRLSTQVLLQLLERIFAGRLAIDRKSTRLNSSHYS